mmetsp:Transcript_23632/g.58389  ORF Transcript_23632/g.58389 Transcript_23632/m.58389 type:complete len:251 (-) Transcript_23632:525-1277(-)
MRRLRQRGEALGDKRQLDDEQRAARLCAQPIDEAHIRQRPQPDAMHENERHARTRRGRRGRHARRACDWRCAAEDRRHRRGGCGSGGGGRVRGLVPIGEVALVMQREAALPHEHRREEAAQDAVGDGIVEERSRPVVGGWRVEVETHAQDRLVVAARERKAPAESRQAALKHRIRRLELGRLRCIELLRLLDMERPAEPLEDIAALQLAHAHWLVALEREAVVCPLPVAGERPAVEPAGDKVGRANRAVA